jgi:hypothetical protein
VNWSGILQTGLACHGLGWYGAEHISLVWCCTVVDVLIVGRDITTINRQGSVTVLYSVHSIMTL